MFPQVIKYDWKCGVFKGTLVSGEQSHAERNQAPKFENCSLIRYAPVVTIICYLTAVIEGSGQLCAGCHEYTKQEEKYPEGAQNLCLRDDE